MKVPFIIFADLECLLEKMKLVIIILKNHQQPKQINTYHLVIHYLHIFHLMQQKISLIIIEVKIA